MSVYSDSGPKLDLGIRLLVGVCFFFFSKHVFFCRYLSGYKLLHLVLIEVDKLEVDPSLHNPPGNIKSLETFYSKCANGNKSSKCRTFASYSSLLQQFKCSPPLKQIALP